ncbi:MAG: hypothetical protein ACXVFV_05115 [Mycobacteriales bacterium]
MMIPTLLLAALTGLPPADAATGPPPPPLAVLHAWDARRAAAWADGDTAALRSLYVAGSRSGAADVAMLRRWRARGVRARGLQMQVLAAEVRAATPHRLVLVVTDRLVGAYAVAAGERVALPRDTPTRHRVVLALVAGEWRAVEAHDLT